MPSKKKKNPISKKRTHIKKKPKTPIRKKK